VGGRDTIEVDLRIVCATHHNLDQLIKEGGFREDLFFRISEIVIEVPALRQRENDKLLLAQTFLHQFSEKNGRSFRGFTEQARVAIDSYEWPGNVRELENRIKRAVVLAEGSRISITDLGFDDPGESNGSLSLRHAREQAEREVIQRALAVHNNNVTQAAAALGISRPSLYQLVKKLDMPELGSQ
jgi:two-component system NtrC family response regulator